MSSADGSCASSPATSGAPPALPPSVEEAYRRKCIQLKQRTAEVEEANDAARLRLARLKRQVEKMRLERAFLLEQLAKRTSTNVEDSDGSPSPPPTVSSPTASASFPPPPNTTTPRLRLSSSEPRSKLNSTPTTQPKEKPLRIKRGHRKPSMLTSFETPSGAGAGGSSVSGAGGVGSGSGGVLLGQSTSQNQNQTHSPSSDAFSTQPLEPGSAANGVRGALGLGAPPRKPGSAFELYCDEQRAELRAKDGSGAASESNNNNNGSAGGAAAAAAAEEEERFTRGWEDLASSRREAFQARADDEMAKYQKEKDAYDAKAKDKAASNSSGGDADSGATEEVDMDADVTIVESGKASRGPDEDDEDVEMGNYDTDQETQGEKPDE